MKRLLDLQKLIVASQFRSIISGEVTLSEKQSDKFLNKICIKGLPSKSIVLKMDDTVINHFFNSTYGINKRADYLLLFIDRNNLFVFYIEMKTGEPSENDQDIIQKFNGTNCLLRYCDSVIKCFFQSNFLQRYFERYVVLYKAPSVTKISSKPMRMQRNDHPQKYLKIPVNNYNPRDPNTKINYLRFFSE